MNKVLLTLETLLLRQDKLVNNGYFLANIGEKIADRLPKFVEIAGGFLAVTLAVAWFFCALFLFVVDEGTQSEKTPI